MLIEFRVRNFRSIRDEQVLSMVANDEPNLLDSNTIETGIESVPRLVRSAAIYGANASGKSNLIKAMGWMQGFVRTSGRNDSNDQIHNDPFLLDDQIKNQPSLFEMTFIIEGVEFRYGFEVTGEKVITEYLFEYNNKDSKSWFEREFDFEAGSYDFVSDLGEGDIEEFWRKSTNPNSLFLSVSGRFNIEKLKPIYNFLTRKLVFKMNYDSFNRLPILPNRFIDDAVSRKKIVEFLRSAGIMLEDIQTKKRIIKQMIRFDKDKEELTEEFMEILELKFLHKTENGSALFDLRQESDGTRKFFYMAGPILEFLESGNILVYDELESSLHSHLVEWIIKLFHSPETNPKGAQLIFTTHNNSIMTEQNFRRDQIWFVDKNRDEASRVFPLTDFRKVDYITLPEGYLEGRYGALPYLSDYKDE